MALNGENRLCLCDVPANSEEGGTMPFPAFSLMLLSQYVKARPTWRNGILFCSSLNCIVLLLGASMYMMSANFSYFMKPPCQV